MSNLVYLMTSLPSLIYGEKPPITIDAFYQEAKSQLSPRSYKQLESVDIQKMNATNGGKKLIAALLDGVKQDLSEVRDARLQNRQPKLEYLPSKAVLGNPLQREIQLMQWQWEELDAIEAGKTFTMTELLVYKLKLQIVCRMHSFNKENGAKVLENVVNPVKNMEVNNDRSEN